jgi:ribose transport system substrate-binding protein
MVKKHSLLSRGLVVLFSLLLVFSLSACSSPQQTPPAQTAPEQSPPAAGDSGAPAEKYKVFLDLSYSGNTWSNETANLIEALSKTPPYDEMVEFKKIISGADVQKQISDLQSMIDEGADAILFYPLNPKAYSAVIDQAQEKGVLIFCYDSTIVHPWAYNISAMTAGFGPNTAQYLVNALGGKGNIFLNRGVAGAAIETMRYEGAMTVFNRYPDIKIITEYVSNWDSVQSKANTLKALAAYPDVDGIWSQDGEWGVLQALEQEGKIVPVTGEGSNGFRNAFITMKDQGFTGVSAGASPTVGSFAFKLAMELLTGKIKEGDVPHNIEYPLPWVTPETVKITEGPDMAGGFNAVSLEKVPATFVCDNYLEPWVTEVDLNSALYATPVEGMTIQPLPVDQIKAAPDVPGLNCDDSVPVPADQYVVNPALVTPIPVP